MRLARWIGACVTFTALLLAAPANADSGTMNPSWSPAGVLWVRVQYTVDSCPASSDPYSCMHSPMIRLGTPGAACLASDQVIAGFRYRSGNATFHDGYELAGVPTGPVHLCLWLQPPGPPGNDRFMGEVTFNNAPPLAPGTSTPVVDKDCADFNYQEDAQRELLAGDPYRLDADHDGVACEHLPSRDRYLTFAEATTIARSRLAHQYGRRWTAGHGKRVVCDLRTSSRTVGCRATWRRGHTRYRAAVVVQRVLGIVRASAKIVSRRPV
jgi:hypothetical protein